MKNVTFTDKVIITMIIMISLIGYGMTAAYGSNVSKNIISVYQGDKVIMQIAVSREKRENRIYKFEFDGGNGAIEMRDNKVRMLPMSTDICPESICSKTGWIEKSYQTIICLPNRVRVSFESKKNETVDGVTF